MSYNRSSFSNSRAALPSPSVGQGSSVRPFEAHSNPNTVILSLGANQPSVFGSAEETFSSACEWLSARGFHDIYMTRPWGSRPFLTGGTLCFLNVILVGYSTLSPRDILRLAKQFERLAGRRVNPHRWSPRPIDIDLVSFGTRVIGWPNPPPRANHLILPHPRAHQRGFVLGPLASVWPDWVHPVIGQRADRLFRDLPKDAAAIPVA
jgi:2-amino-4-hydroxy-6-hydroxymethyldihydropteridine diphosphokinase